MAVDLLSASGYLVGQNLSSASELLAEQDLIQDELQTQFSIWTDQVSQTKLLASLVLFTITLLCGYLPVRVLVNQTVIQYAMFAGGGVLMATAFCHLIPEAHDQYRAARQLLNDNTSTHDHHHHQHSHNHNHQHDNQTEQTHNESAQMSQLEPINLFEHFQIPYLELTLCCGFFFMYLAEQLMVRFVNNHTHEHPCDTSTFQLVGGDSQLNGSSTATVNQIGLNQPPARKSGTEFYKFIRGLLIVSAFGAHSIFDGVSIGSQESVEKVWTIFLAISCHKLIIAAVVGLELYAATLESHLWTLVHLAVFSIMSPLGIILVVVAQNSLNLDSGHPAMILLQSFATGTLLYIVFIEILQPKKGQAHERNRLGKSISLILGFTLMLLVLSLIDH